MTVEQLRSLLAHIPALETRLGRKCVQINCPFGEGHRYGYDKDYKLGITPQSGSEVLWNCFVCHASGTSLQSLLLLMEVEAGIPTIEVRQRLKDYELLATVADIDQLQSYDQIHSRRKSHQYEIFPESHIQPFLGTVPKYALDRGIALESCKCWQLGYDAQLRRLVLPVRDTFGNLVGAVGRTTKKFERKRYHNYWNFERKYFLFGEHLIPRGATVVPVEGPVDVIKTAQALQGTNFFPLGTFGSRMTEEQVRKLMRLTDNCLVTLFDPDKSGKEATDFIRKVCGRSLRMYRAKYPDWVTDKDDPGKLPPEVILSAVLHAELAV